MYHKKHSIRTAQSIIEKYNSRDPFYISECENILIITPSLPPSVKGMAVNCLGRKYISINKSLDFSEKRIIVAHELGHHLLHPGMSRRIIEETTLFPLDRFEREAYEFAAFLLIDPTLIEYGDTIEMIAHRANVSVELVKHFYHAHVII
jgi:Zn-dependent peptidase ImmA (M78 family)